MKPKVKGKLTIKMRVFRKAENKWYNVVPDKARGVMRLEPEDKKPEGVGRG